MTSAGHIGGQYQPLNQNQLEIIHNASLDILEQTGFTFESGLEETLEMLADAGCRLEPGQQRIFFPRQVVLEQIGKAPSQVILYGRADSKALDLSGDRVHLGTGGSALNILDLEHGKVRKTVLQDIYDIGRLVDKLDNIHFYLRPCIPHDIPETAYDVNSLYACLKATNKHVMVGFTNRRGLRQGVEMASMLAGGMDRLQQAPFISAIACFAISPLKLCTQSTLNMQEACRLKIPVALSSAPMAGSTSPMTMAGTLAQLHAEEMAGIVIGQLTSSGAPQLYGGIPGMADLRSMGYCGGGVEFGMMNAAIHQLAAYIKVPNYNSSGLSDSKLPDAQAGWEKAFTTVLAAMGGSNYVHHAAGMLESMLCVAYEQYVMDDEIIGQACKVLEGIVVDEEHLALDTISQVGPGGNYMMAPHTMRHMRSEFYTGNGVSDRSMRDNWQKEGGADSRQRARQMAKDILNQQPEPYIPPELDARIKERFEILLKD
jgi:trimethylamine--corrinoid protein Co-methyltransferase